MKSTILIVEDDRDIMEVVTILLRREGFSVLQAQTGEAALGQALNNPDLIILDIMLPDMDGYEVCRRLRENTLAPVLFLTAKGGLHEKTEGLEAGGDDYLVKPFFQEELLARIRALLRRYREYRGKEQQEPEDQYLEAGGLRVSKEFNEVIRNGERIEMTDIEYKILKLLMQNSEQVVAKLTILERISDDTPDCTEDSLKIHVHNLRRKLKDAAGRDFISAVWGIGYMLSDKA